MIKIMYDADANYIYSNLISKHRYLFTRKDSSTHFTFDVLLDRGPSDSIVIYLIKVMSKSTTSYETRRN